MADAKQMRVGGPVTTNTFSANNIALDASGDKVAWVFQPYSADAITHVGFRYGARTGTPPTYITGLQGVSATTGAPDGTYVGGGTPASVTFTPPADASIDGLWQWKALANSYTPSRGQVLAVVIEHSSGSIDGSNNSSFTRNDSNLSLTSVTYFPYAASNTTGTYGKGAFSNIFGWRTASGRFGYITQSAYATNVSTTGHRSAMHFTLPSGWGDTFKVLGAAFRIGGFATGTAKFSLWDASSELQTLTIDVDQQAGTATGLVNFVFSDATLDTLSFGTKYYIGVECVGSSAVGVRGAQLAEADDRIAFPFGDIRGLATYDGATWTDDNTVMPALELILDDITEPSGGSGGGIVIGSSIVGSIS